MRDGIRDRRHVRRMRMPMVVIVNVRVRMIDFFMHVVVLMALGQV